MAYIHKQTFDIMNFSNADDYLGDCFDCDDMIAPIIQILNRKGYVTTFSCSGHPYEDVLEYLSEVEVDLDTLLKRLSFSSVSMLSLWKRIPFE